MDRLTSIQVFLNVVECRSFVAAADRMQISPAMASKHVMALERHLGTRLLNRTSRSLSLTDDGRLYFEQCRHLLDGLEEVEASITQSKFVPKGLLHLSAPVWFANATFVGILADFRKQYPEVRFDLDISGRFVNLVEEGVDLALRVSQSLGDTLIARPVGSVTFNMLASPDYLRRAGTPTTAVELVAHDMLWYSLLPTDLGNLGFPSVKITPVLSSTDESLLRYATLQGMGISVLPTWLAEEDIRAGRLTTVLSSSMDRQVSIYGVYPSRKNLSFKVRAFLEFLAHDPRMKT
ncbi:LysR family transcriptional regulator [Methylomonas koyamae]|uniref:LysR family transcriptional regulator n=1 Tax=Methylomonas koyamae TaxID=702114 RepID=UPI00112B2396|nr:LysR family transcriptional regulator [Methylomonas koyamae]TPQ25734.1 LysR family transcriptional regulator [Methylomonas koyamae]